MHLSSILKLVTLWVMMSHYLMCCGYEAALLQMGQTAEEDHKVVTHYCGLLKEETTHANTPTHRLSLYFSVTFSYGFTQIDTPLSSLCHFFLSLSPFSLFLAFNKE